VTPERTLEHMRERLLCISRTRQRRKVVMVPIADLVLYADALARTLDERNEFASRVRGPSTPDARAPQTMPVR
jgi:hypothetical protein